MEHLVAAWQWIVSAAGYIVVVALLTSKWWLNGIKNLASKWLDNRFAQKLKDADHKFEERLKKVELQHDVMVRHLQSTIDREMDRAVRLHTKEFDVLAAGWERLHKAYWKARAVTGRGQQVHDLTAMSKGQLNHFIENCDLAKWQKDELGPVNTNAAHQRRGRS